MSNTSPLSLELNGTHAMDESEDSSYDSAKASASLNGIQKITKDLQKTEVTLTLNPSQYKVPSIRAFIISNLDAPEKCGLFLETILLKEVSNRKKADHLLNIFFARAFGRKILKTSVLYVAVQKQKWDALRYFFDLLFKALNKSEKYSIFSKAKSSKKGQKAKKIKTGTKLTTQSLPDHLAYLLIKSAIDATAFQNYCELFNIDFANLNNKELNRTRSTEDLFSLVISAEHHNREIPEQAWPARLQVLLKHGLKLSKSDLETSLSHEKYLANKKYSHKCYQEFLKILLDNINDKPERYNLIQTCYQNHNSKATVMQLLAKGFISDDGTSELGISDEIKLKFYLRYGFLDKYRALKSRLLTSSVASNCAHDICAALSQVLETPYFDQDSSQLANYIIVKEIPQNLSRKTLDELIALFSRFINNISSKVEQPWGEIAMPYHILRDDSKASALHLFHCYHYFSRKIKFFDWHKNYYTTQRSEFFQALLKSSNERIFDLFLEPSNTLDLIEIMKNNSMLLQFFALGTLSLTDETEDHFATVQKRIRKLIKKYLTSGGKLKNLFKAFLHVCTDPGIEQVVINMRKDKQGSPSNLKRIMRVFSPLTELPAIVPKLKTPFLSEMLQYICRSCDIGNRYYLVPVLEFLAHLGADFKVITLENRTLLQLFLENCRDALQKFPNRTTSGVESEDIQVLEFLKKKGVPIQDKIKVAGTPFEKDIFDFIAEQNGQNPRFFQRHLAFFLEQTDTRPLMQAARERYQIQCIRAGGRIKGMHEDRQLVHADGIHQSASESAIELCKAYLFPMLQSEENKTSKLMILESSEHYDSKIFSILNSKETLEIETKIIERFMTVVFAKLKFALWQDYVRKFQHLDPSLRNREVLKRIQPLLLYFNC